MKIKTITYALTGLGLAGALLQNAPAAPKEKPSPEIEAKLTEVIKSSYPDVVITKMGKETEDGLSFVEVAFTTKGVKMDADVMEDGTLVETEQAADTKNRHDVRQSCAGRHFWDKGREAGRADHRL